MAFAAAATVAQSASCTEVATLRSAAMDPGLADSHGAHLVRAAVDARHTLLVSDKREGCT
jgi:predicted amidohydrolase YtcJ